MENKSMMAIKSNKGITLVALVITIVILIILATVAINFAFGDSGLINRASDAKEYYANDITYTDESLSNVESYIDEIIGKRLPEGWDGDKVIPVESSDGVVVPVPKGYTASSVAKESSVSGGFVIYEGTESVTDGNIDISKTTRNQFVWIPVDDISKIANPTSGEDANGRTNYQGKLYEFSASGAKEYTNYGQGTTNIREPDIVKKYDGNDASDGSYFTKAISSTMTGEQFKTQLQEEYNEMIASVDTYGGFYIGRYETGNLSSSVGTEPVVQKGPISSSNWYFAYQNSKLIKANENVVTTMIWGSMWDRTLIWLAETYEITDGFNGKNYEEITDSRTWGNYSNSKGEAATDSGIKQDSGHSENWKANNIYDLAGNTDEWILGVGSNYHRLSRSGQYNTSGSDRAANNIGMAKPYGSYGNSSRSALYIAVNTE